MQHNVVALRGEEARKAYFDNKDLSFTEGLNAFTGGVRQTMRSDDDLGKVNKRIALLLNRNRLTDGERSYHSISLVFNRLIIHRKLLVLPSLFSDIEKRMETWGKQGKMDPFKLISDVCGFRTSFHLERIYIFHIACLSNDCTDGQLC